MVRHQVGVGMLEVEGRGWSGAGAGKRVVGGRGWMVEGVVEVEGRGWVSLDSLGPVGKGQTV